MIRDATSRMPVGRAGAPARTGETGGAGFATCPMCHTPNPVVTSQAGDHTTVGDSGSARIVRTLHELIDALDRRVPHMERVGEVAIARMAATLRAEALKRITTLERHDDADAVASSSEPIQMTA